MASEAQREANQLNAEKSTGPRTFEGKRRSSFNALKHGFTAQEALLPGEDPAQFEQFLKDIVAALDPEGPLEVQLAGRAASLLWRLRRFPSFEVALFEHVKSDLLGPDQVHLGDAGEAKVYYPSKGRDRKIMESMGPRQRAAYELGGVLQRLLRTDVINKLSRYEVTLSRQLKETLYELERLMALRPQPAKLELAPVIHLPHHPAPETPATPDAENGLSNGNAGDARPFPDRLMEG